jgi:hypothetical protein
MPKSREGNAGGWMKGSFSFPLKPTKVVAAETTNEISEFAVKTKHVFR